MPFGHFTLESVDQLLSDFNQQSDLKSLCHSSFVEYHCRVPEIKPKINIKVDRVQSSIQLKKRRERQKERQRQWENQSNKKMRFLQCVLEHVSACDKSKTLVPCKTSYNNIWNWTKRLKWEGHSSCYFNAFSQISIFLFAKEQELSRTLKKYVFSIIHVSGESTWRFGYKLVES